MAPSPTLAYSAGLLQLLQQAQTLQGCCACDHTLLYTTLRYKTLQACMCTCVHAYRHACIHALQNPPSPKRHTGALLVGPFMGVFWALCHGHGHLMAVLVLRGRLMCFDLDGVGFCAHTWFKVQGLSLRADMHTKRKANSEQVYELEATCRARSCALFWVFFQGFGFRVYDFTISRAISWAGKVPL